MSIKEKIVTCPVCGITYVQNNETDETSHKNSHRLFLTATERLQYTPLEPNDQEIAKKSAWEDYKAAKNIEQKAHSVETIIQCHYDRDLRAAIFNNSYLRFPTFEKYVIENINTYPTVDKHTKDYIEKKCS